ncbi:hypothetical protein BDF20DRAFT_864918 [Mycotypha africana]|uniref:uncharacterized protein n=1 Tax=Mycotypha africana TaxID=64632 RepID=UPI002300724C|nr:uncharacterized protein BDF20DRAFT_864918 [Mycotypha africana]KAI8982094.1 hypothetical protein BDF20DRAFT_864918 [Mycotypha africana]
MKFSVAAVSAFALSALSLVAADSYADAIKAWCSGLEVTTPDSSVIAVAGQNMKITVTREENDKEKTITGLDLYSVSSSGEAKYVQNVWAGDYKLKSTASITDDLPSNVSPGLYYYRAWITNLINGRHGPDCIETSHTFKVTSGSHKNAAGIVEYAESIHDNNLYNADHADGCFGISVDYPQEGSTFKNGDHVHIQVKRDASSQTDALTKIELYKGDQLMNTAWQGSESFQNSFVLKDHMNLPAVDPNANDYHYKLYITSKKNDQKTCTFTSSNFKISI